MVGACHKGYFGTKRFDRTLNKSGEINRIHMITASALLETSHRMPTLDYNVLMALALELTKDYSEVEKMYRLMCFNVLAHNRDDHSKNFAFLYDETRGKWSLSPAYDLTYSLFRCKFVHLCCVVLYDGAITRTNFAFKVQ